MGGRRGRSSSSSSSSAAVRAQSSVLYETPASTECTLVLNDRSFISTPSRTSFASLSSHCSGVALVADVYARSSNAHSLSSMGKNVTDAVIAEVDAEIAHALMRTSTR